MNYETPRAYVVKLPARYLANWVALLGLFLAYAAWAEVLTWKHPGIFLVAALSLYVRLLRQRYVVLVYPDRIETTVPFDDPVFRDATLRVTSDTIGLPPFRVRGMRLSNYDGFLAYFAGRVFIAEETPGFEELKHELVRTRPTATDFVLEDQSSP